jgi:competence protein ComEC
MTRRNRMNKKLSPVVAILLIAAAIAAVYFLRKRHEEPQPGPVTGKLVVHFFDIGQGDAELIQLPDGGTILIDSGDRGSPTVDLLKQKGVKEIDLIIATHPHADHIGEMRDVMRAFKVNEFWDAGFPHTTKTYEDMLATIKEKGIKFHAPRRGETRQMGQVLLEVLNPSNDLPDENANNASIVVRLTFGSKRFLFTGDAEVESWEQMLAAGRERVRADLLKAAHHGSSNGTTKEILDAVQPSVFTISCATGNNYHHPHPKVVELLRRDQNTTQVYRTDLHGEIMVVSDGSNIEVSAKNQVAKDKLYMTGDEVAGRVASDGKEENRSSKTGGKKAR